MKEDWQGGHVQMPSLQGPIGAWYFQSLAGINIDPSRPGFKHVILRPETTGTLTWVKAQHDTLFGPIRSEWRRDGGQVEWKVQVPPNVTATAFVPCTDPEKVTESGCSVAQCVWCKACGCESGRLKVELASGTYTFAWSE